MTVAARDRQRAAVIVEEELKAWAPLTVDQVLGALEAARGLAAGREPLGATSGKDRVLLATAYTLKRLERELGALPESFGSALTAADLLRVALAGAATPPAPVLAFKGLA